MELQRQPGANTRVAAHHFVGTDVPGPVGSTATHGHTASPLSSLRAHPPSAPTNGMTSFQALSNVDDQHIILKCWLETCLPMESNKSYQKMPNAPSWIIAILSRPKCLISSLLNKLCRAHFCSPWNPHGIPSFIDNRTFPSVESPTTRKWSQDMREE